MATSIFFNGRVTSVPGSYSEVDASGLAKVGLGASGIVAVLGTAEGGLPATAITKPKDIPRFKRPEKAQAYFRSGELHEVASMLFEPGKDTDIVAGAQEILTLKVNDADQSEAALQASGIDCIDLTSLDYGAFTEQINVELADGTNQGKLITIRFEEITETKDDLGGTVMASLRYDGGATGFTTATAEVDADGNITARATRAGAGLNTDITTAIVSGSKVSAVSSNVGDITQTVTVFGYAVDGTTAQTETLALNGTTPVVGTALWGAVLGVRLSAACAGTVTVKDNDTGGTPTVASLLTTVLSKGLILCDYCHVNRTTFTLKADAASAAKVLVQGRNAAGATLKEIVTLNGTTPVTTVLTTYAFIDVIAVGAVLVARTVTATIVAAETDATVQTTLQKAADYFNAKSEVIAGPLTRGFTFDIESGKTVFLAENLDVLTATDCKATEADFTADLYAIVAWINANSRLVSAEVSATATGVPDNTSSPVFLVGGDEGSETFGNYQAALNLLKRVRVNTIVDLSGDPAVAAAVDAHCAYMGGIGRSERDGFAGALNAAADDVPTKTEYLEQAVDLNSRHIRILGQAFERFNTAGERTEFLPPFLGAIAAGMQAGSPVGTSLTHKFMNVLSLREDVSWNPTDDAEEMIDGGCLIAEEVDGVGRRFVRNVTTHLSTDNIAYVEGSVNEAINYAVFTFRTELEFAVGKRGFAGTLSATRGVARGTLGLLVDQDTITAYRSLDLELLTDVLDVSCEMAPVVPINFVRNNVHLVTLAQLAATQANA